MFGQDLLERLKNFLLDIPKSEANDTVFERERATKDPPEQLIPSVFEGEVRRIRGEIAA